MVSFNPIPTVDLSSFTSSATPGASIDIARQETAKQLARACHLNGCVGITGHGVSSELLKRGFEIAEKLFDLPMEDKLKAPHPKGSVPHRGYSAPGMEKAYTKEDLEKDEHHKEKLRQIVDCKETYEVGSEDNKVQYNIWLPEDVLPGFRAFTTHLYWYVPLQVFPVWINPGRPRHVLEHFTQIMWELNKASMHILDAMIMSLGLSNEEGEYLRSLHSGHNGQLRLAHYPPVPTQQLDNALLSRLPAHTDWSTFTLLFQDSAGGLEFADRDAEGGFLPAVPDGDKLYLNVGDMLMRLSNDYYPSATHRVTAPQDSTTRSTSMTTRRFSIPYFFLPDDEAIVFPQASCTSAENPARYEKVTLASYAEHMSKWQYEKS